MVAVIENELLSGKICFMHRPMDRGQRFGLNLIP